MTTALSTRDALSLWQSLTSGLLHHVSTDLSTRQTAILLAVYLSADPQTVRGLAASLAISKPAVSRAVDTLSMAGLVKRLRDPSDRRSVIVRRTYKGTVVLAEVGEIIQKSLGKLMVAEFQPEDTV